MRLEDNPLPLTLNVSLQRHMHNFVLAIFLASLTVVQRVQESGLMDLKYMLYELLSMFLCMPLTNPYATCVCLLYTAFIPKRYSFIALVQLWCNSSPQVILSLSLPRPPPFTTIKSSHLLISCDEFKTE